MVVSQLINDNGNPASNQFIINLDNGDVAFQSYSSRVCEIRNNGSQVVFGRHWDYSRTTMKHLNIFLRDFGKGYLTGAATIRKAIKDGVSENDYVSVLYDENMV